MNEHHGVQRGADSGRFDLSRGSVAFARNRVYVVSSVGSFEYVLS